MPGPNGSVQAPATPLEWAVAGVAHPGEASSGDLHVVQPFSGGVLLGVIDALGHGAEAAATARVAADTLARYAHEPLGSVLRRCHDALLRTRGAVVSLAALDLAAETMTWLGVGNVEGIVLPANSTQASSSALTPLGGTVGSDLPRPRLELIRIRPGDTLIFATDGVRSGFADGISIAQAPQQIADAILARFAKGTDDALVLVARFAGAAQARP